MEFFGGSTPLASTIKVKDPQPLWLRVFPVFMRIFWFLEEIIYIAFVTFLTGIQNKIAALFDMNFDMKFNMKFSTCPQPFAV